jgi:hypothetical protein
MQVTLGRIINASKSNDILGISDRAKIIDYIQRAIEIAAYRANWDPYVGTLDVCSNNSGCITLPDFVETVLAANVGGSPALGRSSWFEYHINGLGSNANCGAACGVYWDDKMWSPTFQDLHGWSLVAAICEDPIDGNGSLELIVQGETMDANYNQKMALTIPVTGPSSSGVRVPILTGYASTDPKATSFKKITQVTKPVTRGYIKLIGFRPEQLSQAVTIGYYAPHETNPIYKRMKVSCTCESVRVKYRRKTLELVNDYDLVPLDSYQATLDLLKAIRLRETNNIDIAEKYEIKAIQLLNDIQTIKDAATWTPIQVDPSFGVGTIDYR